MSEWEGVSKFAPVGTCVAEALRRRCSAISSAASRIPSSCWLAVKSFSLPPAVAADGPCPARGCQGEGGEGCMLTCHMRRAGTHSSLARPPPRPVGTIATRTIIRTDPHLFSRRLCRRAGAERHSGFAVCLLAGHASVARSLPRAHTAARMLLRAGAGPAQDGLAVGIRARREARGARREARTCAVRPGPAVRVGAGGGARTPRASRRRQGGGRAAAPLRIQSNCMLPSRGSPP